jgi:hypothetical protein
VALLEADVALPVVKTFIDRVRSRAVGQEVTRSLTPGQAVVKIVYDELVELMGAKNDALDLSVQPPAVVLVTGLQGTDKTTTVAKLAYHLRTHQGIERIVFRAHELDQFVVHNLHNRLSGGQAARYFLTHRAAADSIDKRLYHWQCDIGFEERHAYIAKSIDYMILSQSTSTPEALKCMLKSISQLIKHGERRRFELTVKLITGA